MKEALNDFKDHRQNKRLQAGKPRSKKSLECIWHPEKCSDDEIDQPAPIHHDRKPHNDDEPKSLDCIWHPEHCPEGEKSEEEEEIIQISDIEEDPQEDDKPIYNPPSESEPEPEVEPELDSISESEPESTPQEISTPSETEQIDESPSEKDITEVEQ